MAKTADEMTTDFQNARQLVWVTDTKGKVFRRMGAKATNPMGTKWQQVDGELSRGGSAPS